MRFSNNYWKYYNIHAFNLNLHFAGSELLGLNISEIGAIILYKEHMLLFKEQIGGIELINLKF